MVGPYPRSCPAYQLLVFWFSHCHKALSCTWQSQNSNPSALTVEHKTLLSHFCAHLHPFLICRIIALLINEIEICGINCSQRSYVNADKVNSYVRTHKWRLTQVAHITNLNLSQSTLTGKHLTRKPNLPQSQSSNSVLVGSPYSKKQDLRPYKEIPNLLANHALFLGCLF